MNLKVDREFDWKIRLVSHAVIIVLVAFFSALVMGGPPLLVFTLPLAAIAGAIEINRLQRDKREAGIAADSDVHSMRRRRAVLLAGCIALLAIGLIVQALPSQATHDKYWYLFVAPMVLALIVGPVALLMLGWTYLPRRDAPEGR